MLCRDDPFNVYKQIKKNRNKKAFVVGIITEHYTPEDSTSIINVFVLPQIIFLICKKCKMELCKGFNKKSKGVKQ